MTWETEFVLLGLVKEKFISKNFGEAAQILLGQVLEVLERYSAQGYDLSLRQCYYQLVAANIIENKEQSYKNLGSLISDARLAGLIDWDMIDDRGRSVSTNPHWVNPRQFMESVAPQFALDKWEDQLCYVEVMVEKQALEGVLEPVCSSLDIAFSSNKGYSSSSAMYKAGKRLRRAIRNEKECHVIYLGDHDPSGIDMTRDIEDRLRMFAEDESIEIHRVALNMDQIKKLKPPQNPAKMTDSRASDYVARYGRSSWELDAIEPRQLALLVTNEVYGLRDADKWAAAVEREDAMRAELVNLAKKSKFK